MRNFTWPSPSVIRMYGNSRDGGAFSNCGSMLSKPQLGPFRHTSGEDGGAKTVFLDFAGYGASMSKLQF